MKKLCWRYSKLLTRRTPTTVADVAMEFARDVEFRSRITGVCVATLSAPPDRPHLPTNTSQLLKVSATIDNGTGHDGQRVESGGVDDEDEDWLPLDEDDDEETADQK